MTLDELNQYASMQREYLEHSQNIIELYEKAMGISSAIGDGICGSNRTNKPAIVVDIVDEKSKIEKLQTDINSQTRNIINYIVSIEDTFVRRALMYRAIYGYQWIKIADILGTSTASIKQACSRYVRKH